MTENQKPPVVAEGGALSKAADGFSNILGQSGNLASSLGPWLGFAALILALVLFAAVMRPEAAWLYLAMFTIAILYAIWIKHKYPAS